MKSYKSPVQKSPQQWGACRWWAVKLDERNNHSFRIICSQSCEAGQLKMAVIDWSGCLRVPGPRPRSSAHITRRRQRAYALYWYFKSYQHIHRAISISYSSIFISIYLLIMLDLQNCSHIEIIFHRVLTNKTRCNTEVNPL